MSFIYVLLQSLGGIIAIWANFQMYKVIKNDKKSHQSFTSWALWFVFDTIIAISTISVCGNWILPVVYSVSSFFVVVMIAKKDGFQIHIIEAITIIIVIFLVIMLWIFAGNINTITICTIGIVISSVPQIWDTFKKPHETPSLVYCIFLGAEGITCVGGKSWAIEERFYALAQLVVCMIIILLSLRQTKLRYTD